MNKILESVNFHFYPYCNFQCLYCFARFKAVDQTLSKRNCLKIIQELANNGTQKLNFVGGEPTLCSYLGDLVNFTKKMGLITSIVSNGTGITQKFIEKYGNKIDWIGLSIDSGIEEIQKKLGRGNGTLVKDIIQKSKMVKSEGIKLKINSVITRFNYTEDMSNLIEIINPNRWKVFQALEIEEQNDITIKNLLITKEEFEEFVKKHSYLNPIVENNEIMLDSYIMIDPKGRFYQNSHNRYYFSRPILGAGVLPAIEDIHFNWTKFLERGASYGW